MLSINKLCELLNEFDSTLKRKEDCLSLFIEGAFDCSEQNLSKLSQFVTGTDLGLSSYITLIIDGTPIAIEDFLDFVTQTPFPAEFQLTLDTKQLVQEACSGGGDIDEFLFTSVTALQDNLDSLGVLFPLIEGEVNQCSNTRIHVYGLLKGFGGPKLAVVPTVNETYGEFWLQGSQLPSSEHLLKQVHLVTSERINLEPKNFELSWGNLNQEIAKPFKLAFAQHLLVAISSNYYSVDKVQFKGVKHIEGDVSLPNLFDVSSKWLQTLTDSVVWCYQAEDPSIPLQLFVDRLSLEYTSGSLVTVNHNAYSSCLEQAKNNYKFVIAKRSEDYRKELKDIYVDIKSVTDKYMEKSASLSSELIKSLLTVGFVFTAGTISKAIVDQELLHSKEGLLLFKIMGLYLIASFFIRWLNASAELKIAFKALDSWSKKLHSHISTDEVNSLIKAQTKWSKIFYLSSLAVVAYVQCMLGLAAFCAEGVLFYLGL